MVAERQFGVISDILGEWEGTATIKLPKVLMPESAGVFTQYGMVRTMPGANMGAFVDNAGDKVQTPDGNPIIHQRRHVSPAGEEYPFIFTKAHIYLWVEGGKAYTTMFTCSTDCTLWTSTTLAGQIVATNGIDLIQVWNESSPGTPFAPLDTAGGLDLDGGGSLLTRARYVGTAEGYLILGATTEDGNFLGRRERWSTGNDLADFNVNGSGDTNYKDFGEGSDLIKGFGNFTYNRARIFVVFKEESTYAQWAVEGLSVWNTAKTEGDVGLLATHAVANDQDGNLYYVADDYTVRQFNRGVISQAKAKTLRGMNVSLIDQIQATFWKPYNQILWSIPGDAGSTELDSVLALNIEYGIWHTYPFSIRSFGAWTQQTSYTIDGLDALSTTIDGLDAQLPSIDFIEGTVGFALDLVADHSGYTYVAHSSETDKGQDVTHNMVISVDMADKKALRQFKRVWDSTAYLVSRSATGSLTLSVKQDNAKNFSALGTLSLESDNAVAEVDVPFDIRAKHFLVKLEGTILFDFIGQYWTFEFDGDR